MAQISCVFAVDIAVQPVTKLFHHRHECTELIFIIHGNGDVCSMNEYRAYHQGQIIIYQPGVTHADKAKTDGIQFCLGVQGAGAEMLPIGVWNCSSSVWSLVERIRSLMQHSEDQCKSLDMDILAGTLTMELRHELQGKTSITPVFNEADICKQAKDELDAHIDMPFSIDQLNKKIFVSKSHLRKLFKQRYGESPISYLIRKKLDMAEELLQMTDLSVNEIAARIGMDNSFYFSSLFKRKKGVSPTVYRKQYLQKSAK